MWLEGGLQAISKANTVESVERITQAIRKVSATVPEYEERYPEFREIAKPMLDAWAQGLENIKLDAKPGKTGK
jgi:serine/threonine-protein kinase HipA